MLTDTVLTALEFLIGTPVVPNLIIFEETEYDEDYIEGMTWTDGEYIYVRLFPNASTRTACHEAVHVKQLINKELLLESEAYLMEEILLNKLSPVRCTECGHGTKEYSIMPKRGVVCNHCILLVE